MSIYTSPVSELQDLVEKPVEREWLDLKSWIDLKENVARADCARHLAAISNYGGGYLVFGFNDDGTRCGRIDNVRTLYGHDVFAGIIEKYLLPKFQCEVSFPECAGVEHAVVWIPTHGMSPVISKADGPRDGKGLPQGIRSGFIYIRTPKPESVPVSTPEHLDKVIQRCVLARRDELLGMFSAMMSGGTAKPAADDVRDRLNKWHQATQRAAIQEAGRMGLELPYPLAENFVQLSYLVRHRNGEQIPADKALVIIEKLNTAVRDTVRYGWSMFFPFTRQEISPQFVTDAAVDGGDSEFVQTSLYEDGQTGHGDFWRISLDGRASILRNLHEDRFRTPNGVQEGQKWFDPWIQVRDITEIVRHAWAFAEEFSDVTEICFQLEWKGLKSRVIASLNSERYWSKTYTSHSDWRSVYECVPQAQVIGDLPGVVAKLFAPIHRMFNPRSEISAEYVARAMKGFIVQGL
jgi:Putative DNA-binding domain